jgi:putrescine---pyruvate transaminase
VLSTETSFWHPYADMGSVRHSEHVMERAEDVWVWDTDGNRYLDATAGLWYANVGHGRPEIRAAVAAQMERLEACSAFFDLATCRGITRDWGGNETAAEWSHAAGS